MLTPAKGTSKSKPFALLQEWRVNSTETRENETIIVNRLIVNRNMTLTLVNCSLLVNSSVENRGKIEVYGALVLRNHTTIRASNASIGYYFYLYSTSTFNGSDSTIRDVGRNANHLRERGIHIKSAKATIQNMIITNCQKGLIFTDPGLLRINSSQIVVNGVGIRITDEGSNITVENCVIGWNWAGIIIDNSWWGHQNGANNTIQQNAIVNNYEYGVGMYDSINNTVRRNLLINQSRGIYLYLSKSNLIEENEIEMNPTGWGITLAEGSSANTIKQNIIQSGDIGIFMNSSSPNFLIGNQIRNTLEAAISVESCRSGDSIFSNEITANFGVALKMSDSKLIRVENNTFQIFDETNPGIFIEETEECSFFTNQILAAGPGFHLLDSSNILFSRNVVSSNSSTFLFANGFTKNITLTLFEEAMNSSLNDGSTLKVVPNASVESEIASMTLYVNNKTLASTSNPPLELILNTNDIGGGNFIVDVEIVFLNGTTVNWMFSLSVQGRPRVSTTNSETANWEILGTLLTSLIIICKRWNTKKRDL
ncbi:MAG: NosD domain-containing protein [Candidatus Hodarchaeales archaeon]